MDSSIFRHFAWIILTKKIVIPCRLHIFNQHHQAEQLRRRSQSRAQQMHPVKCYTISSLSCICRALL